MAGLQIIIIELNWKLVPERRDRDEDLLARGRFQATKKKNGDAGLTANCECDWYKIFQRWNKQIQIIRIGGHLYWGRFENINFARSQPQQRRIAIGTVQELSLVQRHQGFKLKKNYC